MPKTAELTILRFLRTIETPMIILFQGETWADQRHCLEVAKIAGLELKEGTDYEIVSRGPAPEVLGLGRRSPEECAKHDCLGCAVCGRAPGGTIFL